MRFVVLLSVLWCALVTCAKSETVVEEVYVPKEPITIWSTDSESVYTGPYDFVIKHTLKFWGIETFAEYLAMVTEDSRSILDTEDRRKHFESRSGRPWSITYCSFVRLTDEKGPFVAAQWFAGPKEALDKEPDTLEEWRYLSRFYRPLPGGGWAADLLLGESESRYLSETFGKARRSNLLSDLGKRLPLSPKAGGPKVPVAIEGGFVPSEPIEFISPGIDFIFDQAPYGMVMKYLNTAGQASTWEEYTALWTEDSRQATTNLKLKSDFEQEVAKGPWRLTVYSVVQFVHEGESMIGVQYQKRAHGVAQVDPDRVEGDNPRYLTLFLRRIRKQTQQDQKEPIWAEDRKVRESSLGKALATERRQDLFRILVR